MRYFLLSLCLLTVLSCNLFNPSGQTAFPLTSPEEKMALAQSAIHTGDWDRAIELYQEAIEKDSSKSFAYYGYAKAVGLKYGIKEGLDDLFLFDRSDDSENAKEKNEQKTNYLRATYSIKPALEALINRDTLASKKMDRYIKESDILSDYQAIALIFAVLDFTDTNKDTVINELDNQDLIYDLLDFVQDNQGGFAPNELETEGEISQGGGSSSNTSYEDANEVLKQLKESSAIGDENVELLETLLGDELPEEVEEQQDEWEMAEYATFYNFQDGKDNDGDGCVDEEVLDDIDNDGDGFVDEDSRVAPWNELYVHTGSLRMAVEEEFTTPTNIIGTAISLTPSGRLTFTTAEGFWASENLSHRQAMASRLEAQTPPYNDLSSEELQSAQENIGGCWNLPPYAAP